MLIKTTKNLVLLVSLILSVSLSTPVFAALSNQHKTQLKQLRERIGGLRDELNEIRGEHKSVRTELRNTEYTINKFVIVLNAINRNIKRQKTELRTQKKEKQRYQNDKAIQLELLAGQVRSAYAIGRQEYVKLLLNQERPESVGRVLRYYQYFNAERSERVIRANKIVAKLDRLTIAINRKVLDLESLSKKQRTQKAALENTKRARILVLARLNSELLNKGEELELLIQNENKLTRLFREIKQVMPDIPYGLGRHTKFAKLKGKLYWPTVGKIQNIFGTTRKNNKLKWNGIIIKAKSGMNVRSISRGRVAYADWLRGYGLLVIVDHGDGYMSLYGHNESLHKETGDWIEANEVIASVGNSGGKNITGLYFEIRHNGKPTNPSRWCKKSRRI